MKHICGSGWLNRICVYKWYVFCFTFNKKKIKSSCSHTDVIFVKNILACSLNYLPVVYFMSSTSAACLPLSLQLTSWLLMLACKRTKQVFI